MGGPPRADPTDVGVPSCRPGWDDIYAKSLVSFLAARQDVRVLHITRDLRDVIVSHFYHYRIQRNSDLDFSDYYWSIGRFKAHEVTIYNRTWELDSPNLFATQFGLLKSDFDDEVARIGSFIGKTLSPGEIALIAERTSLRALRKARNEEDKPESERFFRKSASKLNCTGVIAR